MERNNRTTDSVKSLDAEPPVSSKLCHGSGKPSLSPSMAVVNDTQIPPSSLTTSTSFVPKPFPPTSLAGIPLQYILDQLHTLAPHYWGKTETADCTLVIPVPYPRSKGSGSISLATPSYDPSGLGRRVTEPSVHSIPRLYLKLHTDYLSAHSSFLRALFSGASPFDLINTTRPADEPHRTPSGRFTIPADRLPRLLPSSRPDHPVLFLPVPDPTSIDHLIHWMYFGDISFIDRDLSQGTIEWEGIARNVEYLGLSTEIKVFLGHWYGRWLHPERRRPYSPTCAGNDDDAGSSSDTLYSDDEDDYAFDDDSDDSASDTEDCSDMDVEDDMEEKEQPRGRPLWNHRRAPSWNMPFTTPNGGPTPAIPPEISPLDPTVP